MHPNSLREAVAQQGQPAGQAPAAGAAGADASGRMPAGAGAVAGSAPAAAPTSNARTSQGTLLLSEIRDGMVIMKDGTFRAVVACQSINFDLMSENERSGVEYSYQNFLNSLGFQVQILVRSQKIDIGPYLDKLAAIRRNQDNMLLNVLMDDYMDFIDIIARDANIMDKSFFVVIPYSTLEGEVSGMKEYVKQSKGLFGSMFGSDPAPLVKIDRPTYERATAEIIKRVSLIIDGLRAIGVPAVQLGTKELGTLYYNFNNPDIAVREPLVDWTKYTHMYSSKAPTAAKEAAGASGVAGVPEGGQ